MLLSRSFGFTFPGLILLTLLAPPGIHASPEGSEHSLEPVLEQLRVGIEEERTASGIPAIQVAVIVGGEIVWSKAFGWANMDAEIPATPETRFGIGSISKTITMITCARLVDEGRLAWDIPIESYLADFPHAKKGITVRNIGAHLSGMGDASADSVSGTTKPCTTQEAYREVVKTPLVHEPGAAHLYATDPFTVIAAVIEELEGVSFPEVVAREVTDPLGLDNTLPNNPLIEIPRRTSFYVRGEDSLRTDESNPSCILAGAGYLSSAENLVTLGYAVLIGDFLSPERRADLVTDMKTRDGAWTFFGLGWRLGRSEEWGFFYGNSGGGPGIASTVLVIPDHDVAVSVCTNLTDAPAWDITRMTAERVVSALR